jgi:Membrane bound beta barrel domain (DUF5777)
MKYIYNSVLIVIFVTTTNFLFATGKDSLAKSNTPVTIFNSTRVINGHSTDMLWKNEMDIRISHRFGDMGTSGSAATAFGLDNSTDIRIGVEYGLLNNLNAGLARCKGAGPFTQIADGYLKYNFMQQNEEKTKPLSITFLQTMAYTFMKESTDSTLPSSFGGQNVRRMAYCSQLLLGRKFGQRLSIIIAPTYVHRNYVAFDDENGLFSVGASVRLKITKVFSLITEYFYNIRSKNAILGVDYYNPLGIGFEFDTGGHLFMLNFTNSTGLGETQFIPYTASSWSKGQFRMGFTISRIIKFKQH